MTMHRALALAVASVLGTSGVMSSGMGTPVPIVASDDFTLHAEFFAADGTDHVAPGVLLLHQCDREGEETGYERLADMLAQRGVHMLMLDFRGYGDSRDETFTGENWQEAGRHFAGDVEAAFQHLVAMDSVDPNRIGIVGASCGGKYAIHLARQSSGVQALAFLSCGLGPDAAATLEGVRDLPLFCVAAEDDPFGRAPASMREAFEASNHPDSRLVMYKGDKHGTPLFEQDLTLGTTMADWLVRRLGVKTETLKTENRNEDKGSV